MAKGGVPPVECPLRLARRSRMDWSRQPAAGKDFAYDATSRQ